MPEFSYTDLLPLGADGTSYRRLTGDGVSNHRSFGRNFFEIEPRLLTLLTATAMRDIAHLLRPAHLSQLRSILQDPQASPNDRYVARDLLKNACIAAGGVLPMCQDTGTAIVTGRRGQHVLTDGRDEEHIARGVYDAYTTLNLRYSQLAPLTMWDERNTGSNLPAQVEIYATAGEEYTFGGKYFCHDVRVIRLPRHGASCPVAVAVSCSADRQALGKITADGVFLEQLETDPAQYLPDPQAAEEDGEVVAVDLSRPMAEIRAELTRYPVRTRVSLTGPLVVARDIAHAKIAERLDAGEAVWQIEVRDFPAFIVVDDKGNDFFADPSGPVLSIGAHP